ncbi:hypothetical protein CK203_018766 [Vitis vinifera]|uniref:Uncharacterized protein n=1 Tax=Vitis vinifera TaxID=29760 RepID=A0A438JAV7_VITVI|nr:hypothetical protein CK203_018766 [Vitis vinifera]
MYFLWPDKYVAYTTPHSGAVDKDFDKLSLSNENGFLWDTTSAGSSELLMEDGLPKESISEVGSLTCYPGLRSACFTSAISSLLSGVRLLAGEMAHGTTSSSVVNQQVQKRANSPRASVQLLHRYSFCYYLTSFAHLHLRLPQSIPSKRSKEELMRGSQSLSSSWPQKNGHTIS